MPEVHKSPSIDNSDGSNSRTPEKELPCQAWYGGPKNIPLQATLWPRGSKYVKLSPEICTQSLRTSNLPISCQVWSVPEELPQQICSYPMLSIREHKKLTAACRFLQMFDLIHLCFYVLHFDIFSLAIISLTRNCCFQNQKIQSTGKACTSSLKPI